MRIALAALTAVVAGSSAAHAFGLHVAPGSGTVASDAAHVVLMREGTRTVLSLRASYRGPAEPFAIVIPVPAGVREPDVRVLPHDVFVHLEQIGAPRLVQYWEQDPCPSPTDEAALRAAQAAPPTSTGDAAAGEPRVVTGVYQISLIAPKSADELTAWLAREDYHVSEHATAALGSYVASGMKLVVARVAPERLQFEDGRAWLAPLRVHYDSATLALPVRLGALHGGTVDLVVDVLAPGQRYHAANRPNVTIPTNLDLVPAARDELAAFYATLLDATYARFPRAIVTDYAQPVTACDDCAAPVLSPAELALLGADVLVGSREQPRPYTATDFVHTRLRVRSAPDDATELVLEPAPPISGGRELERPSGAIERGTRAATSNAFQARYAIRRPWLGPIRCTTPQRHSWGPPPPEVRSRPGFTDPGVQLALDVVAAPRTASLARLVAGDIPELGRWRGAGQPADDRTSDGAALVVTQSEDRLAARGCCASGAGSAGGGGLLVAAFAIARRVRRPRGRRG